MLEKYYTKNWGIMINERTTEKYSAIYYGIIREGVKKWLEQEFHKLKKNLKEETDFIFKQKLKKYK